MPLTEERVIYLRDLMRDAGAYVESKDFEMNLPVTNFARYHELWSMEEDEEEEEEENQGDNTEDYESAEED